MYGIFYITKNNTAKVLYFFQIKNNNINTNIPTIRIFDLNNIICLCGYCHKQIHYPD